MARQEIHDYIKSIRQPIRVSVFTQFLATFKLSNDKTREIAGHWNEKDTQKYNGHDNPLERWAYLILLAQDWGMPETATLTGFRLRG